MGALIEGSGAAAATNTAGNPERDALVALTEVADVETLALSPDGRSAAFRVQRPSVERNRYAIDWYVADLASGKARRVADGGEAIYDNGLIEADAPVWAPDGTAFYRRAMVGGVIGIARTAADGTGSAQVIGGESDVETVRSQADGRTLSYTTGPTRAAIEAAEDKEYDDGVLVDATIDLRQGLYRQAYVHGRLASQRLLGSWYLRDGLLWRAPRTMHRYDLVAGREVGSEPVTPLLMAGYSPTTVPPPDLLQARSRSGEVARIVARAASGAPELSVQSAKGRNLICGLPACSSGRIGALAWRPDHRQVLFTQQDPTFRQSLFLFDVTAGTVRTIARGDGQLSGGRSERTPCAVSARFALCVEAAAALPPRLVRFDLDTGERLVLLDPNPTLRVEPAPLVERLAVPFGGNRTVSGILLLPPRRTAARLPLFVTYYDCPGYLRGGMGDEFPLGPLATAGFAVACLNTVPLKSGGHAIDNYQTAQAAVEAVIDVLDHRGLIDPRRVGMGGLSFGSEVTMWMAMKTDRLAAAAVASPQPSPSGYWQTAVRGRDAPAVYRAYWQAGSPDEDPEAWRKISPELNTARIKAPLLMQLPEQELASAAQFYARLTNTTTPVELYAYPHESHLKLQPRHRFAVYRRNLDWFRYWLQGHTNVAPEQAAQFRRWGALRARRDGLAE